MAGWIEEVARRYGKTLWLSAFELDQLIKSRFKHAIADAETSNQLLWDDREMSLSQMIENAQRFEDFRSTESMKAKKTLRITESNSFTDQLKKELADLKKQMASLQASIDKKASASAIASPKKPFICWNCGGEGHIARHCKKPKVGDGLSHRPKSKANKQGGTQTQDKGNLN